MVTGGLSLFTPLNHFILICNRYYYHCYCCHINVVIVAIVVVVVIVVIVVVIAVVIVVIVVVIVVIVVNIVIILRCVLAYLHEGLFVRQSVGSSVRPSVGPLVTLQLKTGKSMILSANDEVSCNHIIILLLPIDVL